MRNRLSAALALCLGTLCMICLPAVSHAQAVYGSIFGTVTDNTGASIPGATVTITDEAKGTSVVVQTGASGDYSVEHLIPDLYDIKITFSGFQTYETKGIQVYADSSPKVDAKLTVGGESTTVEVSADTVPVLKSDRADVSTEITAQDVANLPVNGRNFTNLQLLLPGAQTLGWAHASDENPQGSAQIQVDGQAFGGVAFELDGTDNQDAILGIIVINPPLDSVSEVKIATQNFDAEFGKAVSSVMTSQTKSGTNSFHGSLFDYRTSNANLATNPYTQYPAAGSSSTSGLVPPGLKSLFGGSVGGPSPQGQALLLRRLSRAAASCRRQRDDHDSYGAPGQHLPRHRERPTPASRVAISAITRTQAAPATASFTRRMAHLTPGTSFLSV